MRWTGPKILPYAKWSTNGSSAKGFAEVDLQASIGRLCIDESNNIIKDGRDKAIANLTKTKEEVPPPYDAKGGTWSLDLNTKEGIFCNRDGIELISAQYSNISYF